MKLFLNPKIMTNDKETALLAILNGMYSNKHEYLITSVSLIGYAITGKFLKSSNRRERTIIEGIKSAMKSLADKGIIEVVDQNKDDYVLSKKGLEVDTKKEKFIVIDLYEMQKIFSEANKPFNVFSFFCCLLMTINNTTKEWHMSQDDMVSNWKYGKETVNSYLELLEEMQLIYVYRHNKRKADGTYHKLNNSYGRYKDKELVIKAAQDYAKSVECEDVYEKIDRRSIKLRYNAFCNGAKKYNCNSAAVWDLYKECQLYNKSLKSKPIEKIHDGEWKEGEPLDLTVFPDDIIDSYNGKSTDDQWGELEPSTGDWGEPDSMERDFSVEGNFNSVQMDANETVSQKFSKRYREDLNLIDIESLFDDEPKLNKSNKIVLTREEAEELFA